MSCIISAPATGNGKTTVSLLISSWAYTKGLKLQTFKVGPDYLDQQQLSSIGHPICRNLDIFLSGEEWIKKTFFKYACEMDLSLIEGAMGLYDGLGSTDFSSTANVAKVLKLPYVTWTHGGHNHYSLPGWDVTDYRLCQNHISYGIHLKEILKDEKYC